ncbi:MAG: hypothetical protein C0392_14615 [Syntrophus sp. (in: bacteria)]|nr:hypothetical protein [Syntrophus sp. (in: bacteria)]
MVSPYSTNTKEVQMKRVIVFMVMVALVFGAVCVAYAGAEEDVKALALKAAAFIKENGKDKGIAEIMNPKGRFAQPKTGKFNLSGNDFNGIMLVNQSFPEMIGQNHLTLRDANDKYFIKDAIEIAKTKGGGPIEFAFTDPDTKKIGSWKGWVQRVQGMDMFVMGLTWKPRK